MLKKYSKALLILPLFLAFLTIPPKVQAASCTKVTNNMVITKSVTLCAGTYAFADPEQNGAIIIKASNIVVDGSNLTLTGKSFAGYGVMLKGYNKVTLKNFKMQTYYYGLRVEDGYNITISNVNSSNNKKETTGFLDIHRPLAQAYGGGMLVHNVASSFFLNNTFKNQNVGIDIYYGTGNQISTNDASSNTAWGLRMEESRINTITDNQFHHVNRCNNTGCDSAALLLVNNSSNNTIRNNNLTYSGDGFFIGNEDGTPSNDNIIDGNNGSFSSNNAFEATFSTGNTFKNNTASNSNFGFWLGYSHDTTVENNTIKNNTTDGIHWEHGRFGSIKGNQLAGNIRYGIAMTLNSNPGLVSQYPGSETSHDYTISNNKLEDSQRGIFFQYTTNSNINGNKIAGNQSNVYFEDSPATTQPASTTSAVFGTPTIGSTLLTPGDRKIMGKYTATQSATVNNISLYGNWDGGGPTGNIGFIYEDQNGIPGALKAITQVTQINSETPQWWTLQLQSPVTLPAGTYWLGVLMEEAGTYVYYDIGNINQSGKDMDAESFTTGPEPVASEIVLENNNLSMYAGFSSQSAPIFASSNNIVKQNNIVCKSTGGKICQYNAYNNSGKTVDMKSNWWGTTNLLLIKQLIFDNADSSDKAPIIFDPILTSAII